MIKASTAHTYKKLRKQGALSERQIAALEEFESARETRRARQTVAPPTVPVQPPPPPRVEEAPPSLATFASETVEATVKGGRCPACQAEVKDTATACSRCGARVRTDKCAHCGAQLDGGQFCPQCSKPVEAPKPVAGAPTTPQQSIVVAATPPAPLWTVPKVLWSTWAINFWLKKKGLEPLEEEERKEFHEALVPLMNKYLLPVGPWADEIRFAITAGTMIGVRLYFLYVILPEREEKRKRKEEAEQKKATPPVKLAE